MKTTERVFVDQEPHNIPTARVTLVFNPSCSTFYPDRVMIDPEMTLKRFRELTELNPYQIGLFKVVVRDLDDVTLLGLQTGHIGFQHLMGLVACTLDLILLKQKFGWKYPETYLHPKYQGNIADLMLMLSSPKEFVDFILRIKGQTA